MDSAGRPDPAALIDPHVGGGAPPSIEESEALRVLTAAAGRVEGFEPEALARHALAVCEGADFRVAEDALEALVRRAAAARRDELAILARPPGRQGWGRYRVGRRAEPARQYEVWIESFDPPSGSCACADYAKASLGLCKHVFAVLRDRRARARGGRAERGPSLRWDPVRPMTGPGDWLARVHWIDAGAPRGAAPAILAWFRRARGRWRLDARSPGDPARRLEVVEQLARFAARRPDDVEPALPPLLERERARLARTVRHGVPERELARHLRGLKQKLFPYQREGVARFVADGRLLLADDMGLGKTAQAIASAHVLVAAGRVARALIVVPASLKAQWAREWRLFTDLPLTVIDGGPGERAAAYRKAGRGVLLVHYEQVVRDLPAVLAYGADLVVLDEAQRIKNWATKTASAVKQLDAPRRLVLTGTPMENRLDELASIVEWVDEGALEPRWRLPAWHAVRADGRREVVGARNLDTLRERLRPCMLRRVRAEVLAQLPARRDVRVAVPLTEAQQAAHDELTLPISQILGRAAKRPLTHAEFLRLMTLLTQQRILCNGIAQRDFEMVWPDLERARRPTEALLDGLHSPKLAELRELVAALAVTQRRKIVVFSQWRRMLRLAAWAVSDVLAADGARAVFFTGEESQRRRAENLVAFHDDPTARVLFATDAGGVGLNLQRAASACINLDLPWNPAVLEQRIGRIYRMGQRRAIDVYLLVGESGIEGRIAGIVGAKRALFTGLFDGGSDEVAFERGGSFAARVAELVEPAAHVRGAEDEPDDRDEPDPEEAPAAPVSAAAPDPGTVSAWLGQLRVTPSSDGRVLIDAPAEAAQALASLLRGLADQLAGRA